MNMNIKAKTVHSFYCEFETLMKFKKLVNKIPDFTSSQIYRVFLDLYIEDEKFRSLFLKKIKEWKQNKK